MLSISASAATWFAPFVLPICLYVSFTDMRELRITNQANLLLLLVFMVVGAFALPFDAYLWRYTHLAVALVAGILGGWAVSTFIMETSTFIIRTVSTIRTATYTGFFNP
mgnify:CR=1 FL=1